MYVQKFEGFRCGLTFLFLAFTWLPFWSYSMIVFQLRNNLMNTCHGLFSNQCQFQNPTFLHAQPMFLLGLCFMNWMALWMISPTGLKCFGKAHTWCTFKCKSCNTSAKAYLWWLTNCLLWEFVVNVFSCTELNVSRQRLSVLNAQILWFRCPNYLEFHLFVSLHNYEYHMGMLQCP